ncbi:MAG: TRAP transporter substrate-binding protein DctP [Bilophila wadsworthia]
MFRTNQEGWAILDKYWDELNAKTIKESGNRIIGWLDLGYRHVCNSKRPIRTIEDLKGLKIRVPNNPVMINTFRAWGCEPTPSRGTKPSTPFSRRSSTARKLVRGFCVQQV